MKQYMQIMGLKVKDKVTGFVGFVECVSFDLYGCVQVAVKPVVDEKGDQKEGKWFDHKRLVVVDTTPVMELPNFEFAKQEAVSAPKTARRPENGPAEKPRSRG